MNREYAVICDKAIVATDDNTYITDYYEEIDETLKQENKIEALENKINILEDNKIDNIKKPKSLLIFLTLISIPIYAVPLLYMYLLHDSLQNVLEYTIQTKIGEIGFIPFTIIMNEIFACIPLGLIFSTDIYSRYKNKLNKNNAIDIELNELKQILKSEKDKLNEIKKHNVVETKDIKETVIDLNPNKTKNDIESIAEEYYKFGLNFETMYKKYKRGNLDTYLDKHFENMDKNDLKNIVEDKAKEYVKK